MARGVIQLAVAQVQRDLRRLGYYRGGLTGLLDRPTWRAIRRFLRDEGQEGLLPPRRGRPRRRRRR